MLVAILNTCAQEDEEEFDDEVKEMAKKAEEMTLEEKQKHEEEVKRRKEIIKNKIRAVGKVKIILSFIIHDSPYESYHPTNMLI